MDERLSSGSLEATRTPPKGRFSLWWIVLLAFYAAGTYRYADYLLDDAYISLRYSRSLVEGQGLVFNPQERVEGYTNFAWTLLGAGLLRLEVDAMASWKLISFLAALGLLLVVYRYDRDFSPGSWLPAIFWLGGLEAVAYWSTTGLESMAFAFLLTVGILRALKEEKKGGWPLSAVAFALLALTRPEGIFCFALWTVFSRLFPLPARGDKTPDLWRIVPLLRDGAMVGVPWALWFSWRWHYYGALMPNTYYAKITGGAEQWMNGLINLRQWLVTTPVLALALGLALILGWRRRRDAEGVVALRFSLFCLGWIAYVVKVGGDFMPFFRFFLPLTGILALLAAWVVRQLGQDGGRRRQLIVLALFLGHVVIGAASEQTYRAFVAHRTTVVGLETGRWLNGTTDPDALIAVNTAGAIPWASERTTLDTLGLTDATIAHHEIYIISPLWAGHRRGYGDYVLTRRPEIIVWYNAGGGAEPHYLGDHQLADNPFFRFLYQHQSIGLDPPSHEVKGEGLATFWGDPFEVGNVNRSLAPDLGAVFSLENSPWPRTRAESAPIQFHFFRRRSGLNPSNPADPQSLGGFLDEQTARWAHEFAAAPPVDAPARERVNLLCEQALQALKGGRRPEAKRLLSQAASLNAAARSPLVYQYISNVAVLEKNLILAVQAQREALRLAPDSALYRHNLESLLTISWKDFHRGLAAP